MNFAQSFLILFALIASVDTDAAETGNIRGSSSSVEVESDPHVSRELNMMRINHNFGQCRGPVCGSWGDPHIITCDELRYDCQGTGIFTLMKNSLYNIQAYFIPVGEAGQEQRLNLRQFHKSTMTNDVMVEYLGDGTGGENIPKMQVSIPYMESKLETLNEEEDLNERGCYSNTKYVPDIPALRRKKKTVMECREYCESFKFCSYFTYYKNDNSTPHLGKPCFLHRFNAVMKTTPDNGPIAGMPDTCGRPNKYRMRSNEEESSARIGYKGCPIMFYLDDKLVNISSVVDNEYLYGDATSDHSVKFVGDRRILMVHKVPGTEARSEVAVEIGSTSNGEGKLWGCHLDLFVCLPEQVQDRYVDSVGLLGSPDGNKANDWMNVNNRVLPQPNMAIALKRHAAYNYCTNNWCVSEEDSLMVYPSGTSYRHFKCKNEAYSEDVYPDHCVVDHDEINMRCHNHPIDSRHDCKVDCCSGVCPDDNIVIPDPNCVRKNTDKTACPNAEEPLVEIMHASSPLPEGSTLIYDIEFLEDETVYDDGIKGAPQVRFKVENPFDEALDTFIRYESKAGKFANEPKCDCTLSLVQDCNSLAPKVTVGSISFPDIEPFTLVDIYFVGKKEADGTDRVSPEDIVNKCCAHPDAYKDTNNLYKVFFYTIKIQSSCPSSALVQN